MATPSTSASATPTDTSAAPCTPTTLLLRADYRRTIETYDRAAPGAILSLFYERLFGDASIRRLCDFCGLDSRPGPARQPAGGRGALRLTLADKPPAADNRSRI